MSMVDAVVPTTVVVETTATKHTTMGTPDEVIQNMVALGWEVEEEAGSTTTLTHPLITGTKRYINK
jgi:hypothetical protein